MLKKVTALVSCLLLLLLIETLSLCSPAVSAAADPDYILNIDFSKYNEGMTLAEILAADSTIPRISSNSANGTYIVNDNGELEIKTLNAYGNGATLGVNFNVPVSSLPMEVTGKYYIELEAATMSSKQSQYIIRCQSTGGGEQMFCSSFQIGSFNPYYTGYSPSPGSLDPSLTLNVGTTYTFRHLLNMSERRFDGFWSSTDGGVSFQQHTVGGNTYIPYRYSGMNDLAAELPIIRTISLAGANGGVAAAGDLLHKIKHIRIWESEDSILSRASEKLTLAQVNNSSSVVAGNLDLPNSLENFENVNITWSSNNQSIISNSGEVTLPWENTEVTLTATLELNGFIVKKPFPLLARGVSAEDYILVYETFPDARVLAGWDVVSSGGTVTANNGLIMTRTNSTESSCAATLYFGDRTNLFRLTKEISAELKWAASDVNRDASVTFKSGDGAAIAAAQFRGNAGNYTFSHIYAPDGGVPRPAAQSIDTQILGEGTETNSKFRLDAATGTVEFWLNGNKNPLSTVYTLNPVSDISAVTFNVGGANSNCGTLTVNSLKVFVPNSQRLQMNADQLVWPMIAEETADAVTFLTLPQRGTAGVMISWESNKPQVATNEGVVTRGENDEQVTLTATLYREENPSQTLTKSFSFTVKAVDLGNLAYQKPVSSNIVAAAGSILSNVTDGSLINAFVSGGMERNGNICVDLGSVQPVSCVKLYEKPVRGNYKINRYTVEISVDGNTWEIAASGKGIGKSKNISFTLAMARYVRLDIKDKDPGGAFSLAEIEVFFDVADAVVIDADLQELAKIMGKWPYIVSSNLMLPASGTFGSAITWSSDNPGLITNTGNFVESPENDTVVTLTATIRYGSALKTVTCKYLAAGTVVGRTSPGNIGGRSPSGNTGYVPIQPNVTPNVPAENTVNQTGETNLPSKGFNDLANVSWAAQAIEALRVRGVVNGDGKSNFEPDRSVTREEFVKMLVATLNIPIPEAHDLPFWDCAADGWYYGYLAAAFENGIINGMDEQIFGLGQLITRQDMIVIIYRALELIEALPELGAEVLPFTDADEISDYAALAVETLQRAGILRGDDAGRFRAKDNATRSEVAVVLYLLIQ